MLSISSRHRYALALTTAAASWGVATVIAKRAVTEIPPTTLLPVQLAASLTMLIPAVLLKRDRMPWSPELRRLGYLGILNPGISYALSLIGLAYITASLSVLLWATEPILIIGFAWWVLGEKVDRRLIGAAAVALVGVVLVLSQGQGGGGHPLGVILTLAGVAACASYTVVTRKWIASESTIEVVAIQQAAALGFAVVLAGLVSAFTSSEPVTASAAAWASAIGSGILYYGIAFWLYLTGLRHVPATWAGLFLNFIPVFGITAGYLLLDERLSPRQWVGAVLITAVGVLASRQTTVAAER